MTIEFEPKSGFHFGSSAGGTTSKLMLKNTGPGRVAVKLLTMEPSLYIVRPSKAILEPSQSLEVTVKLASSAASKTTYFKSPSQSFLLQSVPLAPGVQCSTPADILRVFSQAKPDAISSVKIRATFEGHQPAASPAANVLTGLKTVKSSGGSADQHSKQQAKSTPLMKEKSIGSFGRLAAAKSKASVRAKKFTSLTAAAGKSVQKLSREKSKSVTGAKKQSQSGNSAKLSLSKSQSLSNRKKKFTSLSKEDHAAAAARAASLPQLSKVKSLTKQGESGKGLSPKTAEKEAQFPPLPPSATAKSVAAKSGPKMATSAARQNKSTEKAPYAAALRSAPPGPPPQKTAGKGGPKIKSQQKVPPPPPPPSSSSSVAAKSGQMHVLERKTSTKPSGLLTVSAKLPTGSPSKSSAAKLSTDLSRTSGAAKSLSKGKEKSKSGSATQAKKSSSTSSSPAGKTSQVPSKGVASTPQSKKAKLPSVQSSAVKSAEKSLSDWKHCSSGKSSHVIVGKSGEKDAGSSSVVSTKSAALKEATSSSNAIVVRKSLAKIQPASAVRAVPPTVGLRKSTELAAAGSSTPANLQKRVASKPPVEKKKMATPLKTAVPQPTKTKEEGKLTIAAEKSAPKIEKAVEGLKVSSLAKFVSTPSEKKTEPPPPPPKAKEEVKSVPAAEKSAPKVEKAEVPKMTSTSSLPSEKKTTPQKAVLLQQPKSKEEEGKTAAAESKSAPKAEGKVEVSKSLVISSSSSPTVKSVIPPPSEKKQEPSKSSVSTPAKEAAAAAAKPAETPPPPPAQDGLKKEEKEAFPFADSFAAAAASRPAIAAAAISLLATGAFVVFRLLRRT